jgi:hypothetical protein
MNNNTTTANPTESIKRVRVNLSELSMSQQEAVIEYMREKKNKLKKERPPSDYNYIVPKEHIKRVYKGQLLKPWTWFLYEWEINDDVLEAFILEE